MPLPLLVPAVGALLGTAAAPALGMSAAVAAGLGSGIASLAAGADPEEALFAGLTGGIGAGLMPGVTSGIQGLAGKGAEAATAAATKAAGQGAAQAAGTGVEAMTKSTIDSLAQQGLGKAGGSGIAGLNIDPKKAAETGLKMAASSGGSQQQQAQPAALPMNPGGAQPVSSSDALANFQTAQAPVPQPQSAAVQPVQVATVGDMEEKRIPLQPIRTLANGGLASIAQPEMQARGLDRLPNLGDRSQAYQMAQYARGGYIQGPGTVTSDDVDGMIYQSGQPVEHIKVADGEVILSGKDLASLDPDGDHERAGRRIGNAPNGTRGKKAAELFMKMQEAA